MITNQGEKVIQTHITRGDIQRRERDTGFGYTPGGWFLLLASPTLAAWKKRAAMRRTLTACAKVYW
ncbi:hypothetical protein GCM10027361_29850 [Erwinia aphidicola]